MYSKISYFVQNIKKYWNSNKVYYANVNLAIMDCTSENMMNN